jgi:chromosome segregation ATPase
MAALDDSVANLQRFIAHLTSAAGGLEKSTEHFKESGQRLGQLEDETADEGGGLNDELAELATELDAGLRGAEEALSEVTQAAVNGQETASQAQDKVEAAASEVEDEAEKTLAELADAKARIVAQGFEALGQRLDESEKELEAETQQLEQAFAQFETSLAEHQAEAEAAWDGAEGELDESIGQLTQEESALEAAAGEGVQGFEAAAGEFEQRCSDLASDVDLVYDALDAAVVEQGQEWEQHVAAMGTAAIGFIESGAQQRLEQPTTMVENDALSALEQEFGALGGVLEAGTDTAGELQPLAEELARCQSVVAQIAELMNALAG